MALEQRWIIRCDHPGCTALQVIENIPQGNRFDYGEAANDAGWDSGPGKKETLCPDHWFWDGSDPGNPHSPVPASCPECRGVGTVRDRGGFQIYSTKTCLACQGSGKQ